MIIILILTPLIIVLWKLSGYQKTAILKETELTTTKTAYDDMKNKYQPIIDVDSETLKRRQQVSELGTRIKGLQGDYSTKAQSLNNQYIQSKQLYDNLKQELSLLEETLELHEYGLYKPHYDYSSSEEYKAALERNYENQRNVVKAGRAAVCSTQWTVGQSRREGDRMVNQNIKLFLRAFNGECDSAIAKVSWNNVVAMEERIKKSFESINKSGTSLQINIANEYLNLKLQELRLTYEHEEKLHQEKEEQRRIQEQKREEEKAQREFEKARQEAEDEEKRYKRALEKARIEMETAKGKELASLNAKMAELEQQLKAVQELKQRAISQAQLTKSGYVYIISNIGSFGEDIFKIGMTRRLDPMERVKELGDASVPFQFDVHAMIYSENAPELERRLHEFFEHGQMNLVNDRKEFYETSIDNIEKFCLANNLKCTMIKVPEAREFRESIILKNQRRVLPLVEIVPEPDNQFPDSLMQR